MNCSSSDPKRKQTLTALALLITDANSVAVTGWDFRYVKDVAQRRGVPIIRVSRHKHAIRADLWLAAIEREDSSSGENAPKTPTVADCGGDPAEAVRAMLGKRRANR